MSPVKKESAQRPHADEHSSVRDNRTPSRRVSSPELGTPRELRMESKVVRAEALLAALPPADPRCRLLQIALLRKDEALLEGILATLERPER
jgi:hypothetical protein